MPSRKTSTGNVFELLARPVLEANGYQVSYQSFIGLSLGGGRHRADIVVRTPADSERLVSMKWQQVTGTAEQKVPFEVIKLIHAVKHSEGRFPYAYLVLGGDGWSSLLDFFLKHGLREYIREYELVRLISLNQFIALANRQAL